MEVCLENSLSRSCGRRRQSFVDYFLSPFIDDLLSRGSQLPRYFDRNKKLNLLDYINNLQSVKNMHFDSTECVKDLDKLNLFKFAYGGLVLNSSQFSLLPQLLQKTIAASKVVKRDSKIIIFLC